MLAITPGMIAGSTLTDAKQVPNVVTQVSAVACGYISGGNWNNFGMCMVGFWGGAAAYGALSQRARSVMTVLRAAVNFIRINPAGLAIAVA